MITERIYVNNRGAGRENALQEMERFSNSFKISPKSRLHLRLLTEEMLGMVSQIGGDFDAEFWAEREGNSCRLYLEAEMDKMDIDKREALIELSSSGRNAAATGFMGKLKNLFEMCCLSYKAGEGYDEFLRASAQNYFPTSITSSSGYFVKLQLDEVGHIDAESYSQEEVEQWDELEKSIVANLADDISVGIKGETVELVITKNF